MKKLLTDSNPNTTTAYSTTPYISYPISKQLTNVCGMKSGNTLNQTKREEISEHVTKMVTEYLQGQLFLECTNQFLATFPNIEILP